MYYSQTCHLNDYHEANLNNVKCSGDVDNSCACKKGKVFWGVSGVVIEDILEDVVPFVIHDAPLFCFNKTWLDSPQKNKIKVGLGWIEYVNDYIVFGSGPIIWYV